MSGIEPEPSDKIAAARPDVGVDPAAAVPWRPADLPERFWDADGGCLRADDLVAAYLDLERKAAEAETRQVPARPEDYVIKIENDLFASDEEVNKKLHQAGFDQAQVQLVYDLAAERLLPVVAQMASRFEAQSEADRLKQEFGGEESWREIARQIRLWGEGNLSPDTFEILASSREGVLAMHKMMVGGEPSMLGNGGPGKGLPTEDELKEMMRDPRYWRDRDPSFVARVREGFRQIYDR